MSIVAAVAPQRAARIATQLIELIDLQKLNPGDRLPPERQLADLLEVSRPSLREALHILQAQGLVQIKHGQGTFTFADGTIKKGLWENNIFRINLGKTLLVRIKI